MFSRSDKKLHTLLSSSMPFLALSVYAFPLEMKEKKKQLTV